MKHFFSLQWHLTDDCDQRCKHCYIYQRRNNFSQGLSIETLEHILEDFISFCKKIDKHPNIALTGGDPLLYHSFWDVVTLIQEKGIKFSILGNSFHLTPEVAKKLNDSGCKSYQMSIDGLEETHDFLRKKGSFKDTLDKISLINNSGIQSVIMTTVSKMNINQIEDIIRLAVEYKVSRFAFARYCPNNKEKENIISPMEYKKLLENCWNIFLEYKDQKSTLFVLKDHLWKLFLYENDLFSVNIDNDYILDGCHCAISHITLLPDGTVYACRRFESPVGKVPEMSFFDIFQNDEMEKYRQFNKFEACSECSLLNYCRGCPAVSVGVLGTFYSKDPQCWYNVNGI
jgi:radical SAM/SPASM domain protein of ACGX system